MPRLRVLDLYCGGGGATKGLQRAGFHVTGVDFFNQPEYCGDDFILANAVQFALDHAHEYDFAWASPPCQGASTITPAAQRAKYRILISQTRKALMKARVPFAMENVPPMEKTGPMRSDLMLCGEMFGLRVVRHRIIECGGFLPQTLRHVEHVGPTKGAGRAVRGTYTTEGYYFPVYGTGGNKGTIEEWQSAMGIDWITDKVTLAEAIPPAYSQYIANEFLGKPIVKEEIRSAYQRGL